MVGRFAGKVVLVTGASRGIGAATARLFASEGASVVLAARDQEALNDVARAIISAGGKALAVPTDVTEPKAVEQLITRIIQTYGRLHAAFNNAGGGTPPTPLAEISVEGFDRTIQVNLRSVFLSMKYEIPAMLAGGGGTIVNMSSTGGLQGVPGIAGYVAGKHAVLGLTKVAALDYASQNIRVNAVAPGPILTERLAAINEENRQQVIRAVPMGRIGLPEEVAATVLWLCSSESAFITGTTITVDGGHLAR
ncbi:MAG TPA: glucose 1-dehydrogenase [Chloroflexia bacterium]|nr:glucose 1-dehydrogenase [Chloroflexia bacterium]